MQLVTNIIITQHWKNNNNKNLILILQFKKFFFKAPKSNDSIASYGRKLVDQSNESLVKIVSSRKCVF